MVIDSKSYNDKGNNHDYDNNAFDTRKVANRDISIINANSNKMQQKHLQQQQ